MNNLSLYELIKQKSKEKNRPLKVICDWDECLQPTKPKMLYDYSPKEKTKDISFSFWVQ